MGERVSGKQGPVVTEVIEGEPIQVGGRELVPVVRVIAWRCMQRQWEYRLGHTPAKRNDDTDALSRLTQPKPRTLPTWTSAARENKAPDLRTLLGKLHETHV